MAQFATMQNRISLISHKAVRRMKTRWVFEIKYNPDETLKGVKARFVACGYSQIEGVDYSEVFAATLAGTSFRLLLSIIADEDLETDQIDAVKAFTQADIDRVQYAAMPQGFAING